MAVSEAVALAVGFDDMHAVGQAVQQGSGQPLGAADFSPLLERQVRRDDQALPLIRPADDFEE